MIDLVAPAPPGLARYRGRALVVGIVAGVASVLGAIGDPNQFFHSYLMAYMFWLGLSLGCLAVLMLQYLANGVWGFMIRRIVEAGSRVLPLMAILFIPIVAGVGHLYPWTHADLVAGDKALQAKQLYLNLPFFYVRAVIYFAGWLGLMWLLNRWSLERDRTGDVGLLFRIRKFAAPGILFYGFSTSFASFDWVMSLEPHWYSTIFGLIIIAGQGVSAFAFSAIVVTFLGRFQPLAAVASVKTLRDVGNLILAFVMLWAYTSFSQLLLIWAGNLPEEIPFYVHRLGMGWQYIGLLLVVFHFFVPFILLLMRATKRIWPALRMVALALLVMRLVDLFWMIGPETHRGRFVISWMDFALPIAIGGLWLSFFLWQLARRPLLPLHDPALSEAIERMAEH